MRSTIELKGFQVPVHRSCSLPDENAGRRTQPSTMATEQPIASTDRLLGAFCESLCGNLHFAQVRKDDMANTARKAVRAFLDDLESELKGYEPVASHGGLVALRRRPLIPPSPPVDGHVPVPSPPVNGLVPTPPPRSELCVCNPVTGNHVSLPSSRIADESFVLLAHDDGQFILHVFNLELAGDGVLQVQTYLSAAGGWGSVVGTCAGLPLKSAARFLRPTPIHLDGVAYFLCESDSKFLGLHVLPIPVAGQRRQPAPIRLPAEVLHAHAKHRFEVDELLLASSTVNGKRRLTLAVAKGFTISLWTLDGEGLAGPAARWTRRGFVDLFKIKVLEQGCPPLLKQEGDRVALECFSESSGAVLFHLYRYMLYKLDLRTGMVSLATVYCKRDSTNMCAYHTEDRAMPKC